ncbi:MAG: tRNA pseudouridine(38-40) synthase TruA [Ilumatobacteraceae bacterium]
MRRIRLTVAYDGSPFRGLAEQAGQSTVMGTLRATLEKVVRQPVELVAAGRTDAGVHGWGQVISGDVPATVDPSTLARRLNRLCAPAIAVRSAEWASPSFSARFDAEWRHYRYDVLNQATPDPLLAPTTWHVIEPLDLAAMRLGCDPLIGEHDFSSFCRRPKAAAGQPEVSLVRRILSATWSPVEHDRTDGLLRFEIRGTAFCHQMVRSIVGTLVDVGRGRRRAGDVARIIAARTRTAASPPAPPHGLCLWEVGYPDDLALVAP